MNKRLICAIMLLMVTLTMSSQVTVHVYGSQWEEFPLVKKIGLYQTHEGVYTKGRSFVLPWGTKRSPDEIVEVESLNDCDLDVAAHQPEEFGGRILISFELQNVGAGVKQNFQLTKGTSTGVDKMPELDEWTVDILNGKSGNVYNLCGQRLPHLVKGINIVRNHNGCARKVYIK